eukprot:365548-Chlamydomonas_euryale.AAC.5
MYGTLNGTGHSPRDIPQEARGTARTPVRQAPRDSRGTQGARGTARKPVTHATLFAPLGAANCHVPQGVNEP